MPFGWFKKKKREIDPARVVAAARAIVDDYGAFLEQDPHAVAIQDEKCLPHPKEAILTALCVAIATEGASTDRRDALAAGATLLAYFQKGVGNYPVYPGGVDVSKFNVESMSGENLMALILSNPAGKEKYDNLLPRVQADTDRINRRIDEASRR